MSNLDSESKINELLGDGFTNLDKTDQHKKLIDLAHDLITPNDNVGTKIIKERTQKQLNNNKIGFELLLRACNMNMDWHDCQSLGEFYISGLKGVTEINKYMAGYYYIKAIKSITLNEYKTSNVTYFEFIFNNIIDVIEEVVLNSSNNNQFNISINELILYLNKLMNNISNDKLKIHICYLNGLISKHMKRYNNSSIYFLMTLKYKASSFMSNVCIKQSQIELKDIKSQYINELKKCHECNKSSSTIFRCSACKLVYYCSKECQLKNWKMLHKKHCKLIRISK